MSDPTNDDVPAGPLIFLDVTLIAQFAETMRLRHEHAPSPERDQLYRQLRDLRNRLAHGIGSTLATPESREAMLDLLDQLVQLERGSLGTAEARALRRRTQATMIAEILNRTDCHS